MGALILFTDNSSSNAFLNFQKKFHWPAELTKKFTDFNLKLHLPATNLILRSTRHKTCKLQKIRASCFRYQQGRLE